LAESEDKEQSGKRLCLKRTKVHCRRVIEFEVVFGKIQSDIMCHFYQQCFITD
jgi:hypothetical protein